MNDHGDSRTINDLGDGFDSIGNSIGMINMERHIRVRMENEDGEMAIRFHMAKFRMTRRTAKEVYGQYGDTPIVLRRMDYENIIKDYQ